MEPAQDGVDAGISRWPLRALLLCSVARVEPDGCYVCGTALPPHAQEGQPRGSGQEVAQAQGVRNTADRSGDSRVALEVGVLTPCPCAHRGVKAKPISGASVEELKKKRDQSAAARATVRATVFAARLENNFPKNDPNPCPE